MLSAEIIAIGSELLTPGFHRYEFDLPHRAAERDRHSGRDERRSSGDDENYLEQAVRGCLDRTPMLITIGGLGPTEDDVTKKVVARVLQRQLVLDDEILADDSEALQGARRGDAGEQCAAGAGPDRIRRSGK